MGLVKAVVAACAAALVGRIATKRRALTNAIKGLLHHDEEAASMSAPPRIVKPRATPENRSRRSRVL